jgi:hypothetical protein
MLLSGAWQFRYSNNALICGVCLLAISKIEAQTQQIQALGMLAQSLQNPMQEVDHCQLEVILEY